MRLFWQHGYETTSISDLTAAMQITAPSLYTAFRDKKGLFLEAVERYQRRGSQTGIEIVESAATAKRAASVLLLGAANAFTGKDDPKGCLLASAAATGSAAAQNVQAALAAIRRGIETALRKKAVQDRAAGILPDAADAAALAALTMAVIQGMSVAARDGADRKKLQAIAATALSAWPDSPAAPHSSR